MPTTIAEFTSRIEDQVIDALKAGQETVVETVRNVAGTVERVLPPQAKDGLATTVPTVAEAADKAFGFAERVLGTQREFVTKVVTAWNPTGIKAAPKPAPKVEAPKAATSKAGPASSSAS